MADTTTPKKIRPQFTTPALKASYPRLVVPDTKYNPEGMYSVKLISNPEQAEALREVILKQARLDVVEDIAANPKHKPAADKINVSITDETDEEGNETGSKLITFRQKARIKFTESKGRDKGKEKVAEIHIPLFDAKGARIWTHDKEGNLLENSPRIGGGSTLKIAFEVITSYQNDKKTFHASLRPTAVQIIDLVQPPMTTKDASTFGFGQEEGYTSEDSFHDTSAPVTKEATPSEAAGNY